MGERGAVGAWVSMEQRQSPSRAAPLVGLLQFGCGVGGHTKSGCRLQVRRVE